VLTQVQLNFVSLSALHYLRANTQNSDPQRQWRVNYDEKADDEFLHKQEMDIIILKKVPTLILT
jgi:hypothetical protein